MQKVVVMMMLSMAVFGENLYVQSMRSDLRSEPTLSAAVVAILARGEKVELLNTKGGWLQVKTTQGEGWMSRLTLSAREPIRQMSLSGMDQNIDTTRRRASTMTAAGATRGLSADDRARSGDAVLLDLRALNKMETLYPQSEDVVKFWEDRGK